MVEIIRKIIEEHPWFVDGLLTLILAAIAIGLAAAVMRIAGSHFKEFIEFLLQERAESARGKYTVGSINWRAIRLVTILGVVIIAALEFSKILLFVTTIIGLEKAEYFHKAANLPTLLFAIALVAIVSILAVVADNRNKP